MLSDNLQLRLYNMTEKLRKVFEYLLEDTFGSWADTNHWLTALSKRPEDF